VRTLMGGESLSGNGGQGEGIGDLKSLQPTLMAGVPMVWERVKKAMDTQVNKAGWIASTIFRTALATKWYMWNWWGRENWITQLIDYLVLYKAKQATGGRLRAGLTGGAPISKETHQFLHSTLCFLVQGYGLTEVTGLGFLADFGGPPTLDTIGFPSPALEVKLQDVPEAGYFAKDGQGQMLIRGNSLMRGYYKQPELTKEAFSDGWFKTGDVARVNPNGSFTIIDRAKNLVKLSNGEYIALERIESVYRNSHSIKNICIVANSLKDYIIGVVEPTNEKDSDESILKDVQGAARAAGLSKAEIITKVIVSRGKGEWNVIGLLTTSGKVKRRDTQNLFKGEIQKIYL